MLISGVLVAPAVQQRPAVVAAPAQCPSPCPQTCAAQSCSPSCCQSSAPSHPGVYPHPLYPAPAQQWPVQPQPQVNMQYPPHALLPGGPMMPQNDGGWVNYGRKKRSAEIEDIIRNEE